MKQQIKVIPLLLLITYPFICILGSNKNEHKESGWYHIIENDKLPTKTEEHYWYSIQDSTEYKKLEKDLIEELEKPKFSSHASYYMKSEAYKAYKKYLHNNIDYINLMFQGFLFKDINGLYGYLIDDIIQSKYPSAPSIRSYINKTDNTDDEKFAVYEWQRKVWFLMNTTQENAVQSDYKKSKD